MSYILPTTPTLIPETLPLFKARAQRLILAHISGEPATPIEIIWRLGARGYVEVPVNTVYVALSRLSDAHLITWIPMMNPIQREARGYKLTLPGEDVLYAWGEAIIDAVYAEMRAKTRAELH